MTQETYEAVSSIFHRYIEDLESNLFIYGDHVLNAYTDEVEHMVYILGYQAISVVNRMCFLFNISENIYTYHELIYSMVTSEILCKHFVGNVCFDVPSLKQQISELNHIFFQNIFNETISYLEVNDNDNMGKKFRKCEAGAVES